MSTAETSSYPSPPIDSASEAALQEGGLRLGLVDTTDAVAFDAWIRSESRGFLDGIPSAESLAATRDAVGYRRTTGVWDDSIPEPTEPVATINSWLGELTVPGDRVISGWAISGVSVAPTHRRRGIARNLLQGELRTAVAAGAPLAMLTVSEATIYGRFGFSPAAMAADWTIDTRRANWIGPVPAGRVDFISREQFVEEAPQLHDRVRLTQPGEVGAWPGLWRRMAGISSDDQSSARKIRFLRFTETDGTVSGLAVFRYKEDDTDFSKHTAEVDFLLTSTPDAYAGLWRFVLELDLVSSVTVGLRAVEEPVRWMISDFRAATVRVRDHEWLRVLDVPAVLEGRQYRGSGRVVLEVSDPLGFADGRWMLVVDESGTATVTAVDGSGADSTAADETPRVALGIDDLAGIYLGGVALSTLAAAGRLPEATGDADGIRLVDRLFSGVVPRLGIWY